jgi:hypothetical protein
MSPAPIPRPGVYLQGTRITTVEELLAEYYPASFNASRNLARVKTASNFV